MFLKIEYRTNPNFTETSTEEVNELDTYYIKNKQLYCYGYNETNKIRDKDKKLETCIFRINEKDDSLKNTKDMNKVIKASIIGLFILVFGLCLCVGLHQMEIGLFSIALVVFLGFGLQSLDKVVYMKCADFYALHKKEIKNYDVKEEESK